MHLNHDPLQVDEIVINKYTKNIVKIVAKAGSLYIGKVIEPGPGQVPTAKEFKIGASWWNFFDRWNGQCGK